MLLKSIRSTPTLIKRAMPILLLSVIIFFTITTILPILNSSPAPSTAAWLSPKSPSPKSSSSFLRTPPTKPRTSLSPQQLGAGNVTISEPSSLRPRTHLIFNNKDLCRSTNDPEGNNRTAVIWVNSARENFMQRNLIRKTWGAVKSYNNVTFVAVVFMLGNRDRNGLKIANAARLNAEKAKFGDIIIGDFVDVYRNLTRKAIMAVEWLTTFCPDAQFVVKTDDDVVVNIFNLTKELNALSRSDITSSHIWCPLDINENTITNPKSKYYVKPGTFKNDIFPIHCEGMGWIAPMNVIVRISNEITRSFPGRVLTLDDVFITSTVPLKINEGIPRNEKILFVLKNWCNFDLYNGKYLGKGSNYEFIVKLIQQWPNIRETYAEFRKKVAGTLFLLSHTEQFQEGFIGLWRIIREVYRE